MPTEADARSKARELVQLLQSARPIPLTSQLRFDLGTVYDLADEIEEGAVQNPGGALRALADAALEVKDAARHAMPVPLTDQVRLPRERVDALVRALRVAGA